MNTVRKISSLATHFTKSLLCICLLHAFASTAALAEFHTFTDTKGRTMEAEIESVSGDEVSITRRDGLSTSVDISIFSEKDRAYIREWERKKLERIDVFDVEIIKNSSGKGQFEPTSIRGILEKKWTENYDIVISNTIPKPLENIRVEYLALKFEDALAAKDYKEGDALRTKGKGEIGKLIPREEGTVRTSEIDMRETKLERGYYWKDGGHKKSRDTLKGLWVKIYVDGHLVQEWSDPEDMKSEFKWEK